MSTMKRKGDFSQLQLQPGYPDFRHTDHIECELLYAGPYELCQAKKPARGAKFPGFGNLYVDSVTVKKTAAGLGELRVVLTDEGSSTAGAADDQKPVYEVYWMELHKNLRDHPIYRAGSGWRIDKALTDLDFAQIDRWETESNPELKRQFKFEMRYSEGDTPEIVELSANAQHLASRLLKGRNSYLAAYPVALEITHHRGTFTVSKCPLVLAEKPFTACPDGYVWMRNQDKLTRTGKRGKWQRMKVAIGAEFIDEDYYDLEEGGE